MKHTTFYTDKRDVKRTYTTLENTGYHKFLRDDFKGVTYIHPDNARLQTVDGVPLDKPFARQRSKVERVGS